MKSKLLLSLALVATLTACNNSEPGMERGGKAVNFAFDNAPISRTTVDKTTTSTKFVDGDFVGIFATGGATATNAKYVVTSAADGKLDSTGEAVTCTEGETANFYAYYPYANQETAGAVNFTVATDQSTEQAYNANDFMTSTASSTTTNVTFKFGHKLALVQMVMVGLDEVTSVQLTNCKRTVTWTMSTDGYAAAGSAGDIAMWNVNAKEFWALVPAQTIATGTQLFTIKSGDKTYVFTPTKDITFNQGKKKKFTLKLREGGGDATELDGTFDQNVLDWIDDDTEEGIAEPQEVKPIELITADDGDFTKVPSLNAVNSKDKCAEGWNVVIKDAANTTIALDAANGCVNMVNGTASTGSWYNSTLYYCTAEGKAKAGKYSLEFEIKASADNDIQLALMPCAVANKYFCQANTALSAVSYSKATTEYTKKKIVFDLSKLKDSTASSAVAAEPTSEDLAKVLVYFTPKVKGDTQYSIKNVTLKQVTE